MAQSLVDRLLEAYPKSKILRCSEKTLRRIEAEHKDELMKLISMYGDTPEAIASHFFYIMGKYKIKTPLKCRIKSKLGMLNKDDMKLISDVVLFAQKVGEKKPNS